MTNIARRKILKILGGISLGSFFSLSGQASGSKKMSGIGIKTVNTDVLVVGGGTAGIIAALQASRAGCSTILVENGSQLGGTITTGGVSFPGLFHAWGKQIISGIGWELVTETVNSNDDKLPDFSVPFGKNHPNHQVRINRYLYTLLAEEKCLESGIQLRYYETPIDAQFKDNGWVVHTIGKGTQTRIISDQLIDCTGNAFLTSLAGFNVLREKESQPGSLMFRIGGYDLKSLDMGMIRKRYDEEVKKGRLVREDFRNNIEGLLRSAGDNIQHVTGADSTTSESSTITNINGRSSLLSTLRFLRELPGCEKMKLLSMQPETGVRETYRIDGTYTITKEDYIAGRVFEDSVCYSFYPIDLHDKDGVVPDHLGDGVVPTVPLRALIPKNSRKFMVAGRCVSSDRMANSALRVQASCMAMGQVAGATAALAKKLNKPPLDIPIDTIKSLLKEHKAIVP